MFAGLAFNASRDDRKRAERQIAPSRANRHVQIGHFAILDIVDPAVDVDLGDRSGVLRGSGD
jgi:hypothetical protein